MSGPTVKDKREREARIAKFIPVKEHLETLGYIATIDSYYAHQIHVWNIRQRTSVKSITAILEKAKLLAGLDIQPHTEMGVRIRDIS